MAFIYEINGQRVEFEKEPTERDIDDAARSMRPAAPKSAMPKPVEGAGGAAFGVFRPAGRRPESQQDRAASAEMPLQTARGLVTGSLGAPADILNLPGTIYGAVTGKEPGYKVPMGSEDWNQLLPGRSDTPQAKLARFTGEILAPVPTFKAAKTVAETVPQAVRAAPEFARGVVGQASGKGTKPGERATYAGQYESARQPAGTTYFKPEDLQAWREGMIDTATLNQRATPYTPEQAAALGRTGGMVPYSGQVARAAGESFIEPYTTFRGYVPDVALGALGYYLGGPLGAGVAPALNMLRRGVQATGAARDVNSMRQLGDLGFSPMFPEELAAIQKGQPNPSVITPNAAGPVQPMPEVAPAPAAQVTTQAVDPAEVPRLGYSPTPSVMYGSETGIVGKTADEVAQADLAQRYAPQPVAAAPDIQQATTQGMATTTPVAAEAPAPLRKETAPHENTAAIEQSLQEKVANNPALQGFERQYVIPQTIKEPVENFLNNTTKHAVVYGGPGTGKTSMANEWLARNPDGQIVYIDPVTFNSKQKQRLQDASLTKGKTLYVVDEADKFKKSQVTQLTNLMDATSSNGKFLITSNDINKVAKEFKTGEMAQIKVDPKLSADERGAFALNVARQFNVNKTPAEIEAIAQNPSLKSFRDIKREVSKGYTVKEEPMMGVDSVAGKIDVPAPVSTLIDDFRNNLTPKNVLIVEKSAFKTDPDLSTKLDKVVTPLSMDKAVDIIPQALARSNAASPTYRVVIRNAEDAAQISVFKGLMERSNETAYPTKVIIDDRFGHLDDAIKSRAELINGDMMKKSSGQVIDDVVKRGQNLGVIKQPKNPPPPGVSQMMTNGKVFDSKADYEAQVLLDKLAGKITTGSFVDNGMRYEITEINYGGVPRKILEDLNQPLTQVRVFSEKSNKQISGPAPEVPEKSLRERVEDKIRKRK